MLTLAEDKLPLEKTNTLVDNAMVFNLLPDSMLGVVRDLASQGQDEKQMEVNTARLLWSVRKYGADELVGSSETYTYIQRAATVMRDLGIPEEQVNNLMNSKIPQAVINQGL